LRPGLSEMVLDCSVCSA